MIEINFPLCFFTDESLETFGASMNWGCTSSAESKSTRGNVAVIVAVAVVVLIGFLSLGAEVGSLYWNARQMQSAADSAAFSGAVAMLSGHPADPGSEATAVAAAAGFVTAGSTSVMVNIPPASGGYAGSSNAVEVVVRQCKAMPLASFLIAGGSAHCAAGTWEISRRAVSIIASGSGNCVLALGTGSNGGVSASGGATVDLNECGLYVNSASASAVSATGGAHIDALSVSTVGGVSTSGGGEVTTKNGILTGTQPALDPYAGRAVPAPTPCTALPKLSGGPVTLQPATTGGTVTYCSNMSISGGASVTLKPGVYILKNASFSISGGSSISGTGVTIVLTGSSSGSIGTATISGGSNINLTAPPSGPTAGMVFFQNPAAISGVRNNLSGGTSVKITGAVYFPHQEVDWSGGTATGSQCTQLIAARLVFSGGSYVQSNCANVGVLPIGLGPVQLVE